MRLNKLAVHAAGAAFAFGAVPAAQAVDMKAGDWTFSVNGNVNAHYVNIGCDDGGAQVDGGVACMQNVDSGEDQFSNIRTGLLPAAIVFTVATQQNGWDVSGTFGFYPGIVSNDGGSPNLQQGTGGSAALAPGAANVGLATTGIDARQVFMKFGNANFGEVKMGRDFGLFGFDAIINDMTIPGVGASPNAVGAPANTSLGSIGLGYIYTDTLSQINYTTPDFGGFTATAGIFQTIDSLTAATSLNVAESAPGFHGQLRYGWSSGFVSVNGMSMDVDCTADAVANDGVCVEEDATGFDVNYKQAFGPLELLLSYYTTEGLGATALLVNGFDAAGAARDSDGGLAQLTFTAGATKYGINYGESNLDANAGDAGTLLDKNSKITAGVYHSLTPNLTLLAEYSDVESEAQNGGTIESDNFNVGAFFAF
ncbi:porin [Salinisphaera sp. P385]|uniref:Porin n=1 Tax=Spectribacter acetivorans TaxID=3075603 RepID=A0ABU3BCB8_9GAMM|nr:porin [Salinisphaera sp. P385]MDT0619755.1 porin [Salinisphaera sp. P385]